MKAKLILILSLFISITTVAQQGINYKALIKDNLGNVVANQNITIEFSILEGPEIDFTDVVYIETHMSTTDTNGVVIVNIGEGVPLSGFEDVYNNIDWRNYFGSHFLKVQIDSGSGLTDMGTTEFKAVPYALYAEDSNYSGLENIDEDNGSGWRLIGMNPENYGPIANKAVDLSYSPVASTSRGATGEYATALGYQTTASGQKSFASGVNTIASQSQSTAMGAATIASGFNSVALGLNTKAEAPNSTAIGLYNVGGGDPLLASATDPLFEIGNGNYVDGTNDIRTNALTVLRNGTITAPSFDISEVTDNKALITKEYADANYSGGGSGTNPTGLEALDESNGVGWRLTNQDAENYGNVGNQAVDLSISNDISTSDGATGLRSVALGYSTKASGETATAMGFNTEASGENSTALGYETEASGENSTAFGNSTNAIGLNAIATGELTIASGETSIAMGNGTNANGMLSTAIGRFNIGGGDPANWVETDPLFEIGNGTDFGAKNNALMILKNGTITAPSFDISEITNNKALITKEYADANYSGGGSGTNPTGLEAIDEGDGVGWALVGRIANNYGNIGENAVDLSISNSNLDLYGATGENAFSSGLTTTASGNYSTAMGAGTIASGIVSTAMGSGTIADDLHSMVVGRNNDNTISTTTLFQVGNGARSSERSNAFTVLDNGTITAPSFDISEITDPKALVTKEYSDANSATGLEAIDEGNGTGWRLVGTDPAYYNNIGDRAVDLSYGGDSSFDSGLGAYGMGSVALGLYTTASGINSTAMGFHTLASGDHSTAMGNGNNALGDYSIAMGYSNNATGDYSTVLGNFTEASGDHSTAFGYNTLASGYYSTAMGNNTIADDNSSTVVGIFNDNTSSTTTLFQVGNGTSGNRSNAFTVYENGNIEMGSNTTASGIVSIAMGNLSTATGNYSTAFGSNTNASGVYSTTMGQGTIASGDYSTAFGVYTTAPSYSETAIGRYNTDYTPASTTGWTEFDRLFVIGNGLNFGSKSDAFTVYKNGQTIFGPSNTSASAVRVLIEADAEEDAFKVRVDGVTKFKVNANGGITNSNFSSTFALNLQNNATDLIGRGRAYSWETYSDRRIKSSIREINYGLNTILELRPTAYEHHNTLIDEKSGASRLSQESTPDIGLIAQEVYELVPEVVSKPANDEDLWSIDYTRLVPVLIKGMQEQQKIIENQQKQINELKELVNVKLNEK